MMEQRQGQGGYANTMYEDLLPAMAGRLDADAFVTELCSGFQLLADPVTGLITAESLQMNSAVVLGMEMMSKEEALEMVKVGDIDGDGALTQLEFCILMIRLSPEMMQDASSWLEMALFQELH